MFAIEAAKAGQKILQQSSVIVAAIFVAFLVYVTQRGSLSNYIAILRGAKSDVEPLGNEKPKDSFGIFDAPGTVVNPSNIFEGIFGELPSVTVPGVEKWEDFLPDWMTGGSTVPRNEKTIYDAAGWPKGKPIPKETRDWTNDPGVYEKDGWIIKQETFTLPFRR